MEEVAGMKRRTLAVPRMGAWLVAASVMLAACRGGGEPPTNVGLATPTAPSISQGTALPYLILDRPSPMFRSVDFVSVEEGWMLAGGGLLHTTDGGETWNEIALVTGADIDFVNSDDGWIVGQTGAIYATIDGGRTWSEQDAGTEVHLSDVFTSSSQEAWVVGSGQGFSDAIEYPLPTVLLHTVDGGETWQQVETPRFSWFHRLAFVDQMGWLLGATCEGSVTTRRDESCRTNPEGAVLRTSDGGTTWELVRAGLPERPSDFAFMDERRGWVTGTCLFSQHDCGGLFQTGDGGRTWQRMELNDYEYFDGLAFRDERTGWVIARKDCLDEGPCLYELLGTTDGGKHWKRRRILETGVGQHPLAVASTEEAVYVIGSALALRSTDGGKTLDLMRHPAVALGELEFVDDRVGYSISNGVLLRTEDGGAAWERIGPAPGPRAAFHFFDADNGLAVAPQWDEETRSFVVQRTVDGGKTWTDVSSIAGVGFRSPGNLDFLDDRYGWLAGEAGLFVTPDGGETWERRSVGTLGRSAVSVEFVDPQHAWAIIQSDSGSVYSYLAVRSVDGGRTWRQTREIVDPVSPPRLDAIDAARSWHAQNVWGLRDDGEIEYLSLRDKFYVTEDSGFTWREIDLGPIRVEDFVVLDAATAWVSAVVCDPAPCAGRLLHTADGGQTWMEGALPRPLSGDLIFLDDGTGWLQPSGLGFGSNVTTVDGRTLLVRIR